MITERIKFRHRLLITAYEFLFLCATALGLFVGFLAMVWSRVRILWKLYLHGNYSPLWTSEKSFEKDA